MVRAAQRASTRPGDGAPASLHWLGFGCQPEATSPVLRTPGGPHVQVPDRGSHPPTPAPSGPAALLSAPWPQPGCTLGPPGERSNCATRATRHTNEVRSPRDGTQAAGDSIASRWFRWVVARPGSSCLHRTLPPTDRPTGLPPAPALGFPCRRLQCLRSHRFSCLAPSPGWRLPAPTDSWRHSADESHLSRAVEGSLYLWCLIWVSRVCRVGLLGVPAEMRHGEETQEHKQICCADSTHCADLIGARGCTSIFSGSGSSERQRHSPP